MDYKLDMKVFYEELIEEIMRRTFKKYWSFKLKKELKIEIDDCDPCIKNNGDTCFGCRTGGNPRCLCM